MSKLKELIESLCPDGVPFKRLDTIGVFENIGVDKKTVPGEQLVKLLNYVDVYKNRYIDNSIPNMTVSAPKKKLSACDVKQWDIFVTPTSETKDDIGHSAVITEDLINTVYSYHIMRFRLNNPNRTTACYINYLFESPEIQKQIYRFASGLTRFGLSKYKFGEIVVPFPPLEVQEEIVKILDRFSDYAAELQAELQARKEQYEYYRNLLLTFNPSACGYGTDGKQENNVTTWGGHSYEITWKTMGEIAYIPKERCNVKMLPNGLYVGVENLLKDKAGMRPAVELPTVHDVITFKINDILIGNIRPYLKKIWLANKNGGTNSDVVLIRAKSNDEIIPKFLFYLLSSDNFFFYHNQYAKGAKMPRGDKQMIMQYTIPIPPIELQNKIVSILDRFETLVNDLTQGLPAEIAAVKEQYEYYRNKLLTFKKRS